MCVVCAHLVCVVGCASVPMSGETAHDLWCVLFLRGLALLPHRWGRSPCPQPWEWCEAHVSEGIARAHIKTCVASDGLDYLLEFCKDCSPENPITPRQCGALSRFASACVAQCNSEAALNAGVFQVP